LFEQPTICFNAGRLDLSVVLAIEWQRTTAHDTMTAEGTGRGADGLRAWLHEIATNVCLDMTQSVQRRALAMDLGPSAPAGGFLGAPLDAAALQPVPDRLVLPIDFTAVRW
jgi:RNA polymerase sigma-70 factor (ECF subfamily)